MYSLKGFILKKLGYKYDHAKRMYYKCRSDCCGAYTTKKALLGGKKLTKPFNQYSEKEQQKITFQEFCNNCFKKCNLNWRYSHV